MQEQPPERLSFGETTVASLLSAARLTIDSLGDFSWAETEAAACSRAESLAQLNAHRAPDVLTLQWLRISSQVLAVFQTLEPLIGGARALTILRDALTAPFKERVSEYLFNRFGISSDAPGEAFTKIAENFKRRGQERFGQAFVYVQDVQDTTRSFTNIHRCFFNDFFRANGAAEVTSIFCALDNVWADALHEPRYGVRFDRPTTLAQGDDVCRFQFRRSSRS